MTIRMTRTTILKLIKSGSAILIIAIILAYALSRSLTYARGPHITITSPNNYDTLASTTTHIIGRVERARNITLNGKSLTINEKGDFNEVIIIFPGNNFIKLIASDQFGRSIEQDVEVVGKIQ